MIDLNKELNQLVKQYLDKVIVRYKTNTKCNCWRRESNTPDPDCGRCQGIGWLFKEYLLKCKTFIITNSGVSHEQDFDFGKSFSNALTLYVPINNQSKQLAIDDYIFEIETHNNGKIRYPIKRTRKWQVTDAPSLKADNGSSQFLKVLAKPLTI